MTILDITKPTQRIPGATILPVPPKTSRHTYSLHVPSQTLLPPIPTQDITTRPMSPTVLSYLIKQPNYCPNPIPHIPIHPFPFQDITTRPMPPTPIPNQTPQPTNRLLYPSHTPKSTHSQSNHDKPPIPIPDTIHDPTHLLPPMAMPDIIPPSAATLGL